MSTRAITYQLLKPNGEPETRRLRFELNVLSFDDDAVYPSEVIYSRPDSDGEGTVDLWPNEGGVVASYYKVFFPSGEEKRFTVPTTAGPFTLSALLELGVTISDPQYPTLAGLIGAFNVKLYGALGNGSHNDTEAIQDALDAAAAAGAAVVFPAGTYLVSSGELTATSLQVICLGRVVLKCTDTDSAAVLVVAGSFGSFSSLDSDAIIGSNKIVCAGLASSLSKGDLVQITSDASFDGVTDRQQGEILTVKSVSGSNIYFNEPLHDSYYVLDGPDTTTTDPDPQDADNARAAKITPGRFEVVGTLVVDRTAAAATDDVNGITVALCYNPHGRLEFHGVTHLGLGIQSCYAADFHVVTDNNCLQDNSEGQAAGILGSTMYTRVRGKASFVRHAITVGSTSDTYVGVPWDCVVEDFVGIGGRSTAIFDAHAQVGSIEFNRCRAIGGNIEDPVSATGTATAGFSSGARYTTLRACRAERTISGANVRGTGDPGLVLEAYHIDGLECVEVEGNGFVFNEGDADVTINDLRVNNVWGSSQDPQFFALSLASGAVERWRFSNIHWKNGLLLNYGSEMDGPDTFRLNNASCIIPTPTNDNTYRALQFNHANIKVIQLTDVHSDGAGTFLATLTSSIAPDLIECWGCDAKNIDSEAFALEGVVQRIRVNGGDWGPCNVANPTIFLLDGALTFPYIEFAPARVQEFTRVFQGASGPTLTAYRVGGDLGSVTSIVNAASVTAGVEIVAGSLDFPRHLRGAGSPNGVYTAEKGCTYQRTDGAAGTLLYVNEDGATSWTAFD